jgi:glutamate 5-kinase
MRIVVKIGTRTLTERSEHLSRPRMIELVRQIAQLHNDGNQVLLVSSGAIFAGRDKLGMMHRRKDIAFKQTMAAVGQGRLMGLYEQYFDIYDIAVAQALLTRADLGDRERYLNARNTLLSLLKLRVVPIVNQNDVVAVDEIREQINIGDNDNLSALVANLVDADLLVILTDQEGLFTANPSKDPTAQLIPKVEIIDERIWHLAGGSESGLGTGGMLTKIEAAELTTRSGTHVVIAAGWESDVLLRLVNGESLGTRFPASVDHLESRKRWILAEPPRGDIFLDEGAARAVTEMGKSLLPVGITRVLGDFERGQTVRLLDSNGQELARGVTNYRSIDLAAIQGCQSREIPAILGHEYGAAVVHRTDVVLVKM